MTLLDDTDLDGSAMPPTDRAARSQTLAAGSFAGAWRLPIRLARRETMRRPGRTLLVMALIAVPVAAMTIGSIAVRTANETFAERFERVFGPETDIARTPEYQFGDIDPSTVELPAGTRTVEYRHVMTSVAAEGRERRFVQFTDLDPASRQFERIVDVVEGRPPAAGEALIGPDMAAAWDLGVGDELVLTRPSGTWTVSGIGRRRDGYYMDALAIPGFDSARLAADWPATVTLYDVPDSVAAVDVELLAGRLGGITRDSQFDDETEGSTLAWGWVGGVLALVAIGIVVAAAFATSARRQLVVIGQLSVNGATPVLVRRALALQGTWTGALASLAGIACGLAVLPFLRPFVERVLSRDLSSWAYSPADLVVIALTATIAGSLAALVPSRSAARVPVMSALAGRRPTASPPRWLVPVGLALFGGGLFLVAVAALGARNANGSGGEVIWALTIILGSVGVVFGMVCATPLVVAWLAGLGRSTSLSWRMALRALGRARGRSAAVVAAIAVAVAAAVAGAAISEAAIADSINWRRPILADDTIVISRVETGAIDPIADAGLEDIAVPGAMRAEIDRIVPDAVWTPLRYATVDPVAPAPGDERHWFGPHGPLVADAEVIDMLALHPDDRATLDETGALALRLWYMEIEPGEQGTELAFSTADGTPAVRAPLAEHEVGFSAGEDVGLVLMTPDAAARLGFSIVSRGALVRSPEPFTESQRRALADIRNGEFATMSDAFVEPGDPPRPVETGVEHSPAADYWSVSFDEPASWQGAENDLRTARIIVLVIALVVCLIVVAIGLSLAAAEGRDERDVMHVVGARPASLRRQAGARAIVLAAAGIALGIPTGYAPTKVLYEIIESGSGGSMQVRFPWLVTAALAALVPAVVGLAACCGSGVAQRLRPIRLSRTE